MDEFAAWTRGVLDRHHLTRPHWQTGARVQDWEEDIDTYTCPIGAPVVQSGRQWRDSDAHSDSILVGDHTADVRPPALVTPGPDERIASLRSLSVPNAPLLDSPAALTQRLPPQDVGSDVNPQVVARSGSLHSGTGQSGPVRRQPPPISFDVGSYSPQGSASSTGGRAVSAAPLSPHPASQIAFTSVVAPSRPRRPGTDTVGVVAASATLSARVDGPSPRADRGVRGSQALTPEP